LTKEFLASSFEEHAQVLTAETRLDGWFLHFLAPRMAALVRLGGQAPHVGISRKPGRQKWQTLNNAISAAVNLPADDLVIAEKSFG
jgi:hypothetical protein